MRPAWIRERGRATNSRPAPPPSLLPSAPDWERRHANLPATSRQADTRRSTTEPSGIAGQRDSGRTDQRTDYLPDREGTGPHQRSTIVRIAAINRASTIALPCPWL